MSDARGDAWKPSGGAGNLAPCPARSALALRVSQHKARRVPVEAPQGRRGHWFLRPHLRDRRLVLRILEHTSARRSSAPRAAPNRDRHAFGSNRTADLLAALGGAARSRPRVNGRPGLPSRYPLVASASRRASSCCRRRAFAYLPPSVGEDAPHLWQVPLPVRLFLPARSASAARC